jgi:hypothetical protein
MLKRKPIIFLVAYFIVLIVSGCSKPPAQDIGEAVSKTENYYKQSKGIDCVSAFDGDTVKFRLFLEEQPTDKEASKLLNDVLNTIGKYSNNTNTWDYYNAKFDIGYKTDTIIFVGTKKAGEKLLVKSK